MKHLIKAMVAVVLIFAVDVSLCSCMGWFQKGYVMRSFQGKVIDTDTKEPIEGAVIVAVYQKGSISVSGSGSSELNVQEALTNKNGEFQIPETFVKSKEVKGKPSALIIIFKPGYGTLNNKKAKAIGENKSWPPPEKYVVYELPELKSKVERASNIPGKIFNIPNEKQRLLIQAMNKERISLGFQPYSYP